jgi:drug/metabolite transporter (DMT)-like permease
MTDLLMSNQWIAQIEPRIETRFVGELAALTAACFWAISTLMFGKLGRQLSPLVLNAVKGLFAMGFILLTIALQPNGSEVGSTLPLQATVYLLLSGGIGIGLGDTAYFSAINTLGARRALLLETLAPPVTAVLAWAFLAEQLSIVAILGIGFTIIGIAWVISERVPGSESVKWVAGIRVALLAVLCQAAGAVLSRAALADTAVAPLWSTLLRLLAGLAFMLVLAAMQPHRLGEYRPVAPPLDELAALNSQLPNSWQMRWQQILLALRLAPLLGGVALAAFLGTYLGIWLQQIALKYTAAGIAQSLLATSPLFVLPIAAVLGDRISLRATLGAATALSGVWILLAY